MYSGCFFGELFEGGEERLLAGAEFLTVKEEDDEGTGHGFFGEDAGAAVGDLECVAVDGFSTGGDASPGELFFRLNDCKCGFDGGGATIPDEGGIGGDGGIEANSFDAGHPRGPVWGVGKDMPDAGDRGMDKDFGLGLDGGSSIDAALLGVGGMEGLKRGAAVEERLEH